MSNLNSAISTTTLSVYGTNSQWKGSDYANKFNNSVEINKFLKRHKLPELNQEERDICITLLTKLNLWLPLYS